ncbi:ORF6N domain-containing protein [Candidatus Woesearchaeota archaeon]|nr:ORF6N domain-containing protein [Candidatus Woesearchaeota archaeon]
MSELVASDDVSTKIFTLRGRQVILDRDLAVLYGIETRALKQAVNRNKKRFPSDFMFIINQNEIEMMVSQNVIPSKQFLGGSLPYAFTEQGVANLSSVLNNDKAIDINIKIMRAFVAMRRFISSNVQVFQRLDRIELKQIEHDKKFEQVFKAIEDRSIKPSKGIFFDGQVFDAHKFISSLIRSAKKSITLIDNYVDESVFALFSECQGIKIIIYTQNVTPKLELDVQKFNSQYGSLEIRKFIKSHDRFMIIDEEEVYHFGASLKDLGKKWFAFSSFKKEALEILNKLK